MRIVCPSCEATYDVPDATLGAASRQVRCAKCSTVWSVDPPHPVIDEHDDAHLPPPVAIMPDVTEPPDEPKAISATHRLPTTRKASGSSIAPAIAWLMSLAILGTAVWAAIAWRASIMQFWDRSQWLYRWLGLG